MEISESVLTVWKLETGVKLARMIEPIVIPLGYHVALGGSVLHNEKGSTKDVDIFLYRRNTAVTAVAASPEVVLVSLEQIGIKHKHAVNHRYSGDQKQVFICTFFDKRVDIFFL